MTLHLIQPRELFGPDERQAELTEVWRLNDALFDRITVPHGRPTFEELFSLCRPDVINVIANSDIYFDHTLADHAHTLDTDEVWALSRWDDHGTTLLPYHRPDSQDAWVVHGGPHTVTAPYPMGVPGCDNALAYDLVQRGWHVSNPCSKVKAIHLHRVKWRSYLADPAGLKHPANKVERVPQPYHMVHPC